MISDSKSKEIISNLRSTDSDLVLETIDKLKEAGNSLILPEIIELLHNTELPEIKKSVLNLLSELKNKESVPILMSVIKNEKYANERKELVACCWQNGLSYNAYIPVFIDLVIKEEFLVAFEAFTVIENMYGNIEEKVIEAEIIKIKDALKDAGEQKAYLLNGLLSVIRDIPEEQEFTN